MVLCLSAALIRQTDAKLSEQAHCQTATDLNLKGSSAMEENMKNRIREIQAQQGWNDQSMLAYALDYIALTDGAAKVSFVEFLEIASRNENEMAVDE